MSLHTPSSPTVEADASNSVRRERSIFIRKRNGDREPLNSHKLSDSIASLCHGLHEVDVERILDKVVNGLYDGATSEEIDKLVMHTTAMLIADEPEYSKLAARQLH